VPLYRRSGVRIVLSGHEHNFQHSRVDGIDYFVTGGGGKIRTGRPKGFTDAGTVKWASAVHFLLVKIEGDSAEVVPIGEDGRPLATVDAAGRPAEPRALIQAGEQGRSRG
jgi:tartrate-resistant acid phosphatase type 5